MVDITKCLGEGCPMKKFCYRFTADESEMQSWFAESPFEIKDDVFSCEMYWGEHILEQLENIVNGSL